MKTYLIAIHPLQAMHIKGYLKVIPTTEDKFTFKVVTERIEASVFSAKQVEELVPSLSEDSPLYRIYAENLVEVQA
jgi:hypothetical protein